MVVRHIPLERKDPLVRHRDRPPAPACSLSLYSPREYGMPLSLFPRSNRVRSWNRVTAPHLNSRRGGFTFVELIAALILLGVVFTLSISILTVVARERRGAEQRQFALQHAANLLEQTTIRGWSGISPGIQSLSPPSAEMTLLLPELERHVDVTELKQDYNSRLVTVTIQWKNMQGQVVSPVRLSAWVYPLEGALQ